MRIIQMVMVLDAVVFGVIAIVLYRKTRARLARSEMVYGEVVEIRDARGVTQPAVRYIGPNGQTGTFELGTSNGNWKFKSGMHLRILVDKQDPTKVEVANFLTQWFLVLVFVFMALCSLLGVPVLMHLLEMEQ